MIDPDHGDAVPVKARALELLERHARGANRVYAVSRLELAQAVYGVDKPKLWMMSSLGRALNGLAREGALVRMQAGTESLWGVARHAGLLMARRRRLRP
jgi:hypothetical protein